MNKNLKTISFAFAMFAVVGMISSTSVAFADDDELELEAKLLDYLLNEVGEAEFEVEDNEAELEIEIPSHALQTCDVNIDGVDYLGLVLDDEGEVEIEGLAVDLEINPVTVTCGSDIFKSDTFVSEIDEEDDDEDEEDEDDDEEDEDDEIESSSHKKPKKNRR